MPTGAPRSDEPCRAARREGGAGAPSRLLGDAPAFHGLGGPDAPFRRRLPRNPYPPPIARSRAGSGAQPISTTSRAMRPRGMRKPARVGSRRRSSWTGLSLLSAWIGEHHGEFYGGYGWWGPGGTLLSPHWGISAAGADFEDAVALASRVSSAVTPTFHPAEAGVLRSNWRGCADGAMGDRRSASVSRRRSPIAVSWAA